MNKPKVCLEPGCPELDCKIHARPAWRPREANPRYRLNGWERARRRERVLRRGRYTCHVCGTPGASIADHVVPLAEGGADDESNMRPICPECHRRKTTEEAQRGRPRP